MVAARADGAGVTDSRQVVPSDVGHSSPPWFLFTRAYWCQQKLDYVDEKLLARLLDAGGQQQVCLYPHWRAVAHVLDHEQLTFIRSLAK